MKKNEEKREEKSGISDRWLRSRALLIRNLRPPLVISVLVS